MKTWLASEGVVSMTAETARLAIEALYRIVGESHGVEIEVTIKERKDDD